MQYSVLVVVMQSTPKRRIMSDLYVFCCLSAYLSDLDAWDHHNVSSFLSLFRFLSHTLARVNLVREMEGREQEGG